MNIMYLIFGTFLHQEKKFLVLATSEISYPDGFLFFLELRMKGSLWHWSKNTGKCRKVNKNYI